MRGAGAGSGMPGRIGASLGPGVWGPLRFMGKAAASQLRRYPSELARALRAEGQGGEGEAGSLAVAAAAEPLAARWARAQAKEHANVNAGAGAGAGARGSPLVSWLGHAGVLLRLAGGKTVVCDPVLSERIGLRVGVGARGRVLGPRRLVAAPVGAEGLPQVDVVVITHAHFDHLDKPTLRLLARVSPGAVVVVPRGARGLIPSGFAGVVEVGWEEQVSVAGVRVLALRPAHWGARMVWDRHRGFNSYVVRDEAGEGGDGGGGGGVLLAGDSAETGVFDGLAQRVGPVELAVLGIGAYDPWVHHHATPEQAWGMFERSGAALMLPVHHGTFQLGDEPSGEPLARLLAAAGAAGEGRLLVAGAGEVLVLDGVDGRATVKRV